MTLQRWRDRWPGRLEWELRALDEAGITYIQDEEAFRQGILKLALQVRVGDSDLPLIAVFPAFYPYVRFEVYARTLNLHHHQNPIGKNLCLINQATENWRVGDTLASFLVERLPHVLEAGDTDDVELAAELEDHQGEPFSAYYSYQKDSILLVDSAWSLDSEPHHGTLTLGLQDGVAVTPLRAAVLEVKDSRSRVIARAPQQISQSPLFLHGRRTLSGRWVRVPEPIREEDPRKILEHVAQLWSNLKDPLNRRFDGELVDVVGIVFPEEVGWRESADGWLFVIRHGRGQRTAGQLYHSYLARAGRAGPTDLAARTPGLAALGSKRVALFGLGALGAPLALELARSGVGELRILDNDFVEPGITVRWPLGLPAAGREKAVALAEEIGLHYPYTKIQVFARRIGDPLAGDQELRAIDEMLQGADLVLDATAEPGLWHLLSDLAKERSIPYVVAWGTQGAWGGIVAVFRPGDRDRGCWVCLQHSLTDGTIPRAPEDPASRVQPAGCSSPTFTGTCFDLAPVSNVAARVAVGELLKGEAGGYPRADWDVARISVRDNDGTLIPLRVETFTLGLHPGCDSCRTS